MTLQLSDAEIAAAIVEIERLVLEGKSVSQACRAANISSQTYYRNRQTPTKELKLRRCAKVGMGDGRRARQPKAAMKQDLSMPHNVKTANQ